MGGVRSGFTVPLKRATTTYAEYATTPTRMMGTIRATQILAARSSRTGISAGFDAGNFLNRRVKISRPTWNGDLKQLDPATAGALIT